MNPVYIFASILSLFVLLDLLGLGRMDVLARNIPGRKYWRTFLIIWGVFSIGFCISAMVANPILSGRRDPLPPWLVGAQFIWHFLMLPVLAITLSVDYFAQAIRRAVRSGISRTSAAPQPADLSRRNFLASAAILAAPVATGSLSALAVSQLGKFRVESYDLALPGWPKELDKYTITVIADVHVGEFSTQKMLDDIAETSNRLRSDLVLLPGDLINISRA